MRNLVFGFLVVTTFSSFASTKVSCMEKNSKSAALAIEKINGYTNATAKMIFDTKDDSLTIATIETYQGDGGAVYHVTLDGCKVIGSEIIEEIDR